MDKECNHLCVKCFLLAAKGAPQSEATAFPFWEEEEEEEEKSMEPKKDGIERRGVGEGCS